MIIQYENIGCFIIGVTEARTIMVHRSENRITIDIWNVLFKANTMANFSSLDRSRLLDPNNIYFCYVNYIKGLLKIKSQQNPLFITILIIFIMPCHYPSDIYHSPPGWLKPKKLSGVNILSTWFEITFAVLRSNRQYKAYQYMQN